MKAKQRGILFMLFVPADADVLTNCVLALCSTAFGIVALGKLTGSRLARSPPDQASGLSPAKLLANEMA